ncbi:hypothetical protein PUN28_018022 [Cardiocondyla obscurior]|uniref:Uncharacterized protein n=1 Tax=Cardiocondyla obscurior TaxID=286306 RepID=A0AAW2EJB5_9HYME
MSQRNATQRNARLKHRKTLTDQLGVESSAFLRIRGEKDKQSVDDRRHRLSHSLYANLSFSPRAEISNGHFSLVAKTRARINKLSQRNARQTHRKILTDQLGVESSASPKIRCEKDKQSVDERRHRLSHSLFTRTSLSLQESNGHFSLVAETRTRGRIGNRSAITRNFGRG